MNQSLDKDLEHEVLHCNTELIWGGDHDLEEDIEYDIVTNLSCPKCDFCRSI